METQTVTALARNWVLAASGVDTVLVTVGGGDVIL